MAKKGDATVAGEATPNNRPAQPGWNHPQRILVVLAHPDDPEFFCGATLAMWASQGHEIHYCLLTQGDKGTDRRDISGEELMRIRMEEQKEASAIIGVRTVRFLDYEDGYLIPSIEARKAVVRVIRDVKPDVLVTSDPTNYYPRETYLNHPDHRLAGEIALGAVFPAAGNPMFFPELTQDEGLEPHPVHEIWVTLTHQPNVLIDVTGYWEQKIQALFQHKSQIGDPNKLRERLLSRRTADSTEEDPKFEEGFHRLVLS
jgi:LmbE family N-acetylglucosaminyl deacetylase